jgi:hypothetical protein
VVHVEGLKVPAGRWYIYTLWEISSLHCAFEETEWKVLVSELLLLHVKVLEHLARAVIEC